MNVTKHCRDIAFRLDACETWLTSTLADLGGLTEAEATVAAREFKRLRIAKRDAFHSRYTFTHGAFLDRDIIRRAAGLDGAR